MKSTPNLAVSQELSALLLPWSRRTSDRAVEPLGQFWGSIFMFDQPLTWIEHPL